MDLGLKNRIALVAGSSTGLGEAIARGLAAEGASLILCARDGEQLEKVAGEIRKAHATQAVAVAADLATAAGIESVLSGALARFGHVDILVNNTGGPPAGKFEEITPDLWQRAVELLLFSAVNLTRGVLPEMKKRRWGRILNITSIAVKQPVEDLILSNSIRAAVTGFARTLANEVAPFGVTVNNVLPGYTRTRRLNYLAEKAAAEKGISPADVFGKWQAEIPMGRLAEPRELADMVTFLASERASYVTGTSITVDGGWVRSLL
jgi:3-oxoacyl-[acyl-carrier protein] reductase